MLENINGLKIKALFIIFTDLSNFITHLKLNILEIIINKCVNRRNRKDKSKHISQLYSEKFSQIKGG